jgi:hypothetical protein
VLELDFRAVKFLFFPRRDLNPRHWYTAAPFVKPYVQRIIIKSTDISLDRQASSASVIRFEKLSRDHQLSWRKLLKIIILNFILYIIQVYMYTNLCANILDVYLSFLFVCTESYLFPIRHPVGSYVGYFFRRLYIYIYIHRYNSFLCPHVIKESE